MSETNQPDDPTRPLTPPDERPEPVLGEQPLPGMPAEPEPPTGPPPETGTEQAPGPDEVAPDAVAPDEVAPDEAIGEKEPDAAAVPEEAPEADQPAARSTDEPARPTPMPAAGGGQAWSRIRAGLRPSRGQAIVGAVLGLVAFLAVVQVRLNLADDGYANARREDLIAILDGLGQSTRRLESEISELQQRKSALSSGADRAENARKQAEEQIKVLGILAGTLPAQGPGVRITMTDPDGKVESSNLLDAIEELRDAGAEAIQINDKVRVVASTDFVDDPPGVRVDGTKVESPYVIEAIGDSHNLSEAANFPGGLVSEIEGPQINGAAEVEMLPMLKVTALHTPQEHRYARPAASPTR
jgi:uncharacterized protein YlxW (UPF0749 family)